MKHNPDQDRNAEIQLRVVRFEFSHPTATNVSVAGTFNHWHPTAQPMDPSGGGHWARQAVLLPGTYEYCLVVDGHWMPDPRATTTVPNPFGGRNSILEVPRSPEAIHREEAQNSPLRSSNTWKRQKYI